VSRHVYTPITFVMNLKRYNSLTSSQKDQVHRAARTAVQMSREYGEKNDATLEAKIRKEAPNVKFNNIDAAAFQAAAKPIAEKIGGIAGKDFTAKFVAAAAN
jgi:TRAP-type C4-dicarboxylate transport system substrate-binding protein